MPSDVAAAALRVSIGEDDVLLREGIARILAERRARRGGAVRATPRTSCAAHARLPARRRDRRRADAAPARGRRPASPPCELRRRLPGTGVLILSQFCEPAFALELIGDRPEGVGYLLKERVGDVATFTRRRRARRRRRQRPGPRGRRPDAGAPRRRRPAARRSRRASSPCSPRWPRASRTPASPQTLFISLAAVEKHVTAIFRKLGIASAEHRAPPRPRRPDLPAAASPERALIAVHPQLPRARSAERAASPDAVFAAVVEAASALLDGLPTSLVRFEDDGTSLVVAVRGGGTPTGARAPAQEDSLAARVRGTGRAVRDRRLRRSRRPRCEGGVGRAGRGRRPRQGGGPLVGVARGDLRRPPPAGRHRAPARPVHRRRRGCGRHRPGVETAPGPRRRAGGTAPGGGARGPGRERGGVLRGGRGRGLRSRPGGHHARAPGRGARLHRRRRPRRPGVPGYPRRGGPGGRGAGQRDPADRAGRAPGRLRRPRRTGPRPDDYGVRASVGVPITVDERVWGALAATSTGRPLAADVEQRLGQFADLVAGAVAGVQARAHLQELADEQRALRTVAELVARGAPPERSPRRSRPRRPACCGRRDDADAVRRRPASRRRRVARGSGARGCADRVRTGHPAGPGAAGGAGGAGRRLRS